MYHLSREVISLLDKFIVSVNLSNENTYNHSLTTPRLKRLEILLT